MNDIDTLRTAHKNLRVKSGIRAGETKKGDKKSDYLVITLKEVFVSSYQ